MKKGIFRAHKHDFILRYHIKNEAQFISPNHQIISEHPLVENNELTILVWNIFKQKRINSLALLEHYADKTALILLQEAQATPKLLNFITENQKFADQVPAYSFNDVYAGVMTIANTQALQAIAFKEREPFIRIPKSALITKYALPNRQEMLLVANIHAVNFSFGVKIYHQQIRILLNEISQHQGPVILAGDFNSWNRRRLKLLYYLIRKINLKAVNFTLDNRKTFMGKPLDFVFYRGLNLMKAEIVDTEASDHNGLLVSFRIKG
ncbi:endonuclease/exonuclease/phosphatase family protein [Orbaceae bacterium ac157xtp]